jgi:hypothetical protein
VLPGSGNYLGTQSLLYKENNIWTRLFYEQLWYP